MTDADHRTIGRILGFPSCCVEAWIADLHGHGTGPNLLARNGYIVERVRSEAEMRALEAEVSAAVGYRWPFGAPAADMRKMYVACDAHVGAPGWEA